MAMLHRGQWLFSVCIGRKLSKLIQARTHVQFLSHFVPYEVSKKQELECGSSSFISSSQIQNIAKYLILLIYFFQHLIWIYIRSF